MGWDTNTPVGTGSWYGLYTVGIYHLARNSTSRAVLNGSTMSKDANRDRHRLRRGHPWSELAPQQVRSRSAPRFAATSPANPPSREGRAPTHRSQLTGGISALIKF